MNFEFLHGLPGMGKLYEFCQTAEALALSAPSMSCVSARSALEFIVTLIYRGLDANKPSVSLFEMMSDHDFVAYINDETLLGAMHTVRKLGNLGAHGQKITQQEACENLEQLQFVVGEFCINLCLIADYPPFFSPRAPQEDSALPMVTTQESSKVCSVHSSGEPKADKDVQPESEARTSAPSEETIAAFVERLRTTHFSTSKNRDEGENKRLFVRASLREAEWPIATVSNQALPATACIDMTLQDGTTVDYVLYGRDNKPLAVVECTSSMANPLAGRRKAMHIADVFLAKLGYRPTAYYVTGYHIFCIDPLGFPPRRVFGFHSLEELALLKQRANTRRDITDPVISDDITNRDYQKNAIRSVCRAFTSKRRRSLVVMATGTGKTRVSISLVDVLLKAGWIKNVLFLADRTSLVVQAHKNFNKLLPNVTTSIFSGTSTNRDKNARIIFSTYQTMIRMVDGDTREFGIGRFDLIVVDEAHRSIFSKYGSLFEYFDALMVGLTATPRNELDKSSYSVFQLPDGKPDFAYELEEAIHDGYLVGFSILDRTTEDLRRGIRYDELTDEQKRQVEDAFTFEDDDQPSEISLNGTEISVTKDNVINKGTIDVMLADLMENGIKIDAGDRLGKTFVFARSHKEAELIVERFHLLYGNVWGADFCKLVDSQVEGSLAIIDSFSTRDKLPQIAVSVDMLDTGVDVPDAVNLVIFKRVNSKIKFLQMIGRGTRLSPDLFGPGVDKRGFLAFDYYDNFRYFNANETWSTVTSSAYGDKKETKAPKSTGAYQDTLRLEIICQLQGKQHKTDFEQRYERQLREHFRAAVQSLNNDAIEVARNIGVVNKYRTDGIWDQPITKQEKEEIEHHILSLLPPEHDSMKAKSFDSLILKVESEYDRRLEEGKDPTTIRHGFTSVAAEFTRRMKALLKLKTIPAVVKEEQLITAMMGGHYLLDDFSFERAEQVRLRLRDLMKYLPDRREYHIIDLPDQLIDGGESEGISKRHSYAERVAAYLEDTTNPILAKLRMLEPLTKEEKQELESQFTSKLGTPTDYAAWSGNAPLLPYVRKQVGIAQEAIGEKLNPIIDDPTLNEQQREFLRQLVAYAQANGDVSAKTLQTESPFADIDIIGLFGPAAGKLKRILDTLHKPVVN